MTQSTISTFMTECEHGVPACAECLEAEDIQLWMEHSQLCEEIYEQI